ncbi:hypothetical protein I317_00996 [Kwoniella heveanensis CBS 569]|nr:hypothetical protein I317_00996 [Kwoniella heveanensis CBS 569]
MFKAATPSHDTAGERPEDDQNSTISDDEDSGKDSTSEKTNTFSETNMPPIDLDASEELLVSFLDLISVAIPVAPHSGLEETYDLLNLCEKYLCCQRVIKPVQTEMETKISSSPWEVLTFASNRDDVMLAREALRHMDMDDFCDTKFLECLDPDDEDRISRHPDSTFWGRIRSLQPTWQAELLYITFNEPARVKEGEPARALLSLPDHTENWQNFDPVNVVVV